jgi:hypothetical protein
MKGYHGERVNNDKKAMRIKRLLVIHDYTGEVGLKLMLVH